MDSGSCSVQGKVVKSEGGNDVQSEGVPAATWIEVIVPETLDAETVEWVERLEEGLEFFPPQLSSDGVNGTYFLFDATGKPLAVFKPQDEEGNSFNNPKKEMLCSMGNTKMNQLKQGLLVDGEGALREVAAYLMDLQVCGFYGVPPTILASVGGKTGSLQRFVKNHGCAHDFGPGVFHTRQVHKVGILDIQILNMDRHLGNLLVRKLPRGRGAELIPIDHGFSLPDSLQGATFDWLMWPQCKRPFDKETLQVIESIDVETNLSLLRNLGIREECLQTMKATTAWLKRGARAGLNLQSIAEVFCGGVSSDEPEVPTSLLREL